MGFLFDGLPVYVYRIDRVKRQHNVLTGIGAYLNGGRWNQPGQHVVYTANSRSLAILEMLVHLDLNRHLPSDRIMAKIYIPDDLIRNYKAELKYEWRIFPHGPETTKEWQNQNDGNLAVLEMPSAIVPQERNYLINPYHPSFHLIQVIEVEILDIDQRLHRK